MSLDQAKLIFGFLTLITNGLVLWLLIVFVGARRSARIAGWRDATLENLDGRVLLLAFLIAATSTLGSLYLSEIENLEPCRLCWYQRIAMYPLAALFGVAVLRRDRGVWVYTMPISVAGLALSSWHLLVQWFPTLESVSCQLGVPCSTAYFRVFGFMSIPYMAFSGFLALIALGAVLARSRTSVSTTTSA